MPRLSIITINYNNAAGLRQTIESVVSQVAADFEYLIIDGGSTDESVAVIQHYKDKIAYWISEPDRGIYHAMNKGIQQAKGDYCQFLNSGDWLVSSNVINRMFYQAPQSVILIGNLLKVWLNGRIQRDVTGAGPITFLTLYRGTLNHSSAYIKRSLFDTYGLYDETLKIVADWKFYLLVVGLHNELVAQRDVDVSYFSMDGISASNPDLLRQERQKVLTELLPERILADYDQYWFDIEQMRRLKRLSLVKHALWLFERALFKLEKWTIKL